MLDTSSNAPCVSRIAKRCKKSFVILSTDIPHIKMFMVILKIPCGSDAIHVQNEGGASTQRRTGAAPQYVVFLQSEGGYTHNHNHNQPILSLFSVQENNWQPRNWQIAFLGACLSWWDWAQGKVHPSHLAIKWRVGDKSNQNKKRKICFCPKKHWEIISSRV